MDEKESNSQIKGRENKRGRHGRMANIRGRVWVDLDSEGKAGSERPARRAGYEGSRLCAELPYALPVAGLCVIAIALLLASFNGSWYELVWGVVILCTYPLCKGGLGIVPGIAVLVGIFAFDGIPLFYALLMGVGLLIIFKASS